LDKLVPDRRSLVLVLARRWRWMVWCRRCQVSVGLGVSPLRRAGLLRCALSRCQRPSVSPLDGLQSVTRIRSGRRCRL